MKRRNRASENHNIPLHSTERAHVTVAFSTGAPTMDPRLSFNVPAQSIIRHVYEPLFYHDDHGKLLPVLVKSYAWLDDNTLDLRLRTAVKFHDGSRFTAHDVKYTIDTIIAPDSPSRHSATLFYVAGTEIVNDSTIRIYTNTPARALPWILSLYPLGVLSAGWTKQHQDELATRANGTGPFRLVEYAPRHHAILEANLAYWGKPPRIQRLSIRIVPDDKARVRLLQSPRVMMINNVPTDAVRQVATEHSRVCETITARTIYGQINIKAGPFRDLRIRQALNYAVDKEAIVDGPLGGHGLVANCPVAPTVIGHDKNLAPWPYDPTRAKLLLHEAGYNSRSRLSVRIVGPVGRFRQDERVGQTITEQLRKVGIDATYRGMDEGAYSQARLATDEWEILLSGWCVHTLEADFLLSRNFHAEWTPVGYTNPEARLLLDRARQTPTLRRRVALYRRAQRVIWKDAPWIWLYYQADIHAATRQLSGFTAQPDEFLLFHGASVRGTSRKGAAS